MLVYDALFNALCLTVGWIITYAHSQILDSESLPTENTYSFTEMEYDQQSIPFCQNKCLLSSKVYESVDLKCSPHQQGNFLINLTEESTRKLKREERKNYKKYRRVQKTLKLSKNFPRLLPITHSDEKNKKLIKNSFEGLKKKMNSRSSWLGISLLKSEKIENETGENISDLSQTREYHRILNSSNIPLKENVPISVSALTITENPFSVKNNFSCSVANPFVYSSLPISLHPYAETTSFPAVIQPTSFPVPAVQALPLQTQKFENMTESAVQFQASLPVPEPALFSPEKAYRHRKGILQTQQELEQSQALVPEDADFMPQALKNRILSTEQIPNSTSINSNTFEQQKLAKGPSV